MSVLSAGVPRSYVLGSDVPGPHIHWLLVFLNSMYGVYGISGSSLHWELVSIWSSMCWILVSLDSICCWVLVFMLWTSSRENGVDFALN